MCRGAAAQLLQNGRGAGEPVLDDGEVQELCTPPRPDPTRRAGVGRPTASACGGGSGPWPAAPGRGPRLWAVARSPSISCVASRRPGTTPAKPARSWRTRARPREIAGVVHAAPPRLAEPESVGRQLRLAAAAPARGPQPGHLLGCVAAPSHNSCKTGAELKNPRPTTGDCRSCARRPDSPSRSRSADGSDPRPTAPARARPGPARAGPARPATVTPAPGGGKAAGAAAPRA